MTHTPLTKTPPLATSEINSHDLALNLVDLYWFLHIVDAGSFSVAAQQHGLSKSNLSRKVSQLETRLGVQLLHRNPRFLSLTSIGGEVYRHTLEMLTAAQQVTESVQQALGTPSGQVNLVLPSILNAWLLPVLHNFKQAYPLINIMMSTADCTSEMNSQSIDLALSLSAAPTNSAQIVARPLASLTFVNVINSSCSMNDDYQAIQLSYLTYNTTDCFQVSNYHSAMEAALVGFGYANLPLCICQTGLNNGDLRFYNNQETQQTLYAFTQPHRGITLAVRVLLDYISQHIAQIRTQGILPITPQSDSKQP